MSDDFADTLRSLDRYPGRGDRLDPALVVRAGRRRLRARRLGTAAGACALVLALAIAAPAVLGGRTATPPSGGTSTRTQAPRPVGDAERAVLTDDIQAANLPVAGPGGALVTGDVAGWSLSVTPRGGDWLHPGWPGVDVSWGRDTGHTYRGAEWILRDGAALALTPLSTGESDDAAGDAQVLVGVVPAGIPDPITILSSAAGFELGARGTVKTVEVPTFATLDGRLLYAVVLRGAAATRFAGARWQVTFVGSDGTASIVGCNDAAACALDPLPYDRLAESGVTRFSPASAGTDTIASPSPTVPGTAATPTACAEFPAVGGPGGGSFEGWWNSSPADAHGNILRDPALWPPEPREHPRVALVDTDTATVIETWDRIACGPDPRFVATPQADWPAHSVALVDMSTGETIGILATSNH